MARRTFFNLRSYVDCVYREKLHQLVEKGTINEETARTYLSGVKQIADGLQDRGIHSFRDAHAPEHVEAIFRELRQTKAYKDRTFNRILNAVRHFSKTCLPGRTVLGGTMKASHISNDSHQRGHSEPEKQHLKRAAMKLTGRGRIAYLAAKGAGLR